jgi:putative ABC transport system ATP-binding protein
MGETQVVALRGVSQRIAQGGIVALMGPSGSGKSTLLNLIGALDRPTGGQVVVRGQDVAELDRDAQARFRNATIGFVFQTFNLVPVLTTLENVILPAQLGRQGQVQLGEPVVARARSLLDKVGLAHQIDQRVNRLSGGQMQRVAIARALMNKPPIILADEPTANLDHDTADTVLTVLRDLCTSEGATVVVATHDQHVLTYCHRIVRLRDGRLVGDDVR